MDEKGRDRRHHMNGTTGQDCRERQEEKRRRGEKYDLHAPHRSRASSSLASWWARSRLPAQPPLQAQAPSLQARPRLANQSTEEEDTKGGTSRRYVRKMLFWFKRLFCLHTAGAGEGQPCFSGR